MKNLCFLLCMACFTVGAGSALAEKLELSSEERRDYIAACLYGKIDTYDRELRKEGAGQLLDNFGGSSVEVSPDLLETLPDNERLKFLEKGRECILKLADALKSTLVDARFNARNGNYGEIYLTPEQTEITLGIICERPDIQMQLQLGSLLTGGSITPEVIATWVGLTGAQAKDAFRGVDLNNIDCSKPRICQIRGSVPLETSDLAVDYLGTRLVGVTPLAGSCKGQFGYLNERFIDY